MQRILVLGAGFAGLWAALGAARKLDQAPPAEPVEILVVNARPFHSIRVRNYERDLAATVVPLTEVLDPAGVKWLQGEVIGIDAAAHTVRVATADGERALDYTRLVMALGSVLVHPPIPGLAQHAFDVDSHEGAARLAAHLAALARRPVAQGRGTAVVLGAGLTGSEIAAELPARLAEVLGGEARVILIDREPRIADQMGGAQPVIETALRTLGVELRPGVVVAQVSRAGITLADGETIAAETVIWCGGMRATPLAARFGVQLDGLGRLPVDDRLRVRGVADVFAAGDCASFAIDGTNEAIMSCQYGRPMGRYAGHNVAADLLGQPLLPLRIAAYVTCVDLGPWGAVYTEGRERRLAAQGAAAKATKTRINRERIYPPRTGRREDLLRAAAPELAAPPRPGAAAASIPAA